MWRTARIMFTFKKRTEPGGWARNRQSGEAEPHQPQQVKRNPLPFHSAPFFSSSELSSTVHTHQNNTAGEAAGRAASDHTTYIERKVAGHLHRLACCCVVHQGCSYRAAAGRGTLSILALRSSGVREEMRVFLIYLQRGEGVCVCVSL